MIKFFRHVRQRMIKENRVSKYLVYALGEIILVVIGILIALQLNNWNSEKSAQKDTQDFTVRLLGEVRDNIAETNAEIRIEESQINSAVSLLQMFNADRDTLRSKDLDSLVFFLISKNSIDFKLGTLTEGLNTAKISTITSDSLRTLLYTLPAAIEKVKISEDTEGGDIDNFLTPFLYEHINWRKMDANFSTFKEQVGQTAFPEHNSLDALNYLMFENLIDNRLFNTSMHLKHLKSLKAHLVKLENLLDK